MNTILGLIIIAVGSMGQSSSYVPINKIKEWSWENFWLMQGIFAWLLFPLLGAFMASTPSELIAIYTTNAAASWKAIGYGVLWGVGGLTFGLELAVQPKFNKEKNKVKINDPIAFFDMFCIHPLMVAPRFYISAVKENIPLAFQKTSGILSLRRRIRVINILHDYCYLELA